MKKKTAHLITISKAITTERLEISKKLLNKLNFSFKYSNSILNSHLYYAGTPEERARQINEAYADLDSDYIFTIAGGMGVVHVLDKIDYEAIKNSDKVFVGYSDLTILFNAICQKTGARCLHGPNFGKRFDEFDEVTLSCLFDALSGKNYSINFKKEDIFNYGVVSAPIVGGNLRLLARSLGTGFDIETDGKIVFLEAVDKDESWIYDMLWQLKLAGKFDNVRGIILGQFTNCGDKVDVYLRDFFKDFDCPVIMNQPIGHSEPNVCIPLGEICFIDTFKKQWGIKFSK